MILFANEPPSYRGAMCRAFAVLHQEEARMLPLAASVEEAARRLAPDVVVVSGPEERARRLSQTAPVVNLSYGPGERAVTIRRGSSVARRTLEGFGDLAALIESAVFAPS